LMPAVVGSPFGSPQIGLAAASAQRRVDLRAVRPRTCGRLIADSDQLAELPLAQQLTR